MSFPDDYLRPIWRYESDLAKGVFVLALDPREAAFVLERGWATLDGVRYRCNLNGWSREPDYEGRIAVRCDIDDESDCMTHGEALVAARKHLTAVA